MDKLSIFKGRLTNFRNSNRVVNNARQHRFEDQFQKQKSLPFKHSWSMMAHMHDLRVWTLAYAPSQTGNLERLQELHRLNNEMWY